ncbi:hypothetical protein [Streptomyces cinnamoneus]|uniref:hypothetical protein n=1 Tax=Streptomyces cinnamoneus TaxID=53446 RepID=UPI0015E47C4D|nr:hypothetical protein [Streptomyces cinnamoneus]
MRPSRDVSTDSHVSVTPIYDSLCSEYRRSFRALPFDRSGEEELKFKSFAPQPGGYGYANQLSGPSAYQGQSTYNAVWESYYGNRRGQLPALPPGQRDGRMRGF